MEYEELQPINRDDAETELASSDWQRISVALTRLALHDSDAQWLQHVLLRHLRHEHSWVRGVAAMGLGHVARLHRQLDLDKCLPALKILLVDPDKTVRGKAEDALDDIRMYVKS
jgi:hypothetical protein